MGDSLEVRKNSGRRMSCLNAAFGRVANRGADYTDWRIIGGVDRSEAGFVGFMGLGECLNARRIWSSTGIFADSTDRRSGLLKSGFAGFIGFSGLGVKSRESEFPPTDFY